MEQPSPGHIQPTQPAQRMTNTLPPPDPKNKPKAGILQSLNPGSGSNIQTFIVYNIAVIKDRQHESLTKTRLHRSAQQVSAAIQQPQGAVRPAQQGRHVTTKPQVGIKDNAQITSLRHNVQWNAIHYDVKRRRQPRDRLSATKDQKC